MDTASLPIGQSLGVVNPLFSVLLGGSGSEKQLVGGTQLCPPDSQAQDTKNAEGQLSEAVWSPAAASFVMEEANQAVLAGKENCAGESSSVGQPQAAPQEQEDTLQLGSQRKYLDFSIMTCADEHMQSSQPQPRAPELEQESGAQVSEQQIAGGDSNMLEDARDEDNQQETSSALGASRPAATISQHTVLGGKECKDARLGSQAADDKEMLGSEHQDLLSDEVHASPSKPDDSQAAGAEVCAPRINRYQQLMDSDNEGSDSDSDDNGNPIEAKHGRQLCKAVRNSEEPVAGALEGGVESGAAVGAGRRVFKKVVVVRRGAAAVDDDAWSDDDQGKSVSSRMYS